MGSGISLIDKLVEAVFGMLLFGNIQHGNGDQLPLAVGHAALDTGMELILEKETCDVHSTSSQMNQ